MAVITGVVTTSRIPSIGRAIAKNLQSDPYWKPFFDGFPPVHDWLRVTKPDIAVVFYNDHGFNFFLDKMPTFAVGAAPEYCNADEGWGIPTLPPFRGDQDLSWHVIESLVERNFDITTCQEMLVDHAFTLPLKSLWPVDGPCPQALEEYASFHWAPAGMTGRPHLRRAPRSKPSRTTRPRPVCSH